MEAERVYQEKAARTIQARKDGDGTLQFVDNRPMKQALQRAGDDEEEDTIQEKPKNSIQMKKNETGMPDHLKESIENLSGYSMDDVRVHYNSDKPATVQALAYTQGTDIHVAPGQERHLPHEAWHVAQQMSGRVEPSTEVGGMSVNDNEDLEREADVMEARADSL